MRYLRMRRIRFLLLALLGIVCLAEMLVAYQVPAVHDRVAWRLQAAEGRIRDAVFPHPAAVATPLLRVAENTPGGAGQTTAGSPPEATFAPAGPALPDYVDWPFSRHEWQTWNNCGPDSLAMLLAFWGWEGGQADAAAWLKPNPDDKNVSPEEMESFVHAQTSLRAVVRRGGAVDDLRRLIADGFPVVVERGFEIPEDESGWMGHYTFLTGYDDSSGEFISQDAYRGPRYRWEYDELAGNWRAFNFTYVIVYPVDREAKLRALLGLQFDAAFNRRHAAALAVRETSGLEGQALAFAWFNLGTNLQAVGESAQAAAAFDRARVLGLPWRFTWYLFGMYEAYMAVGRPQDVIVLAGATIDRTDDIEEAWYWRGVAREALGDEEGAIADWRSALVTHPGYAPAVAKLAGLGIAP